MIKQKMSRLEKMTKRMAGVAEFTATALVVCLEVITGIYFLWAYTKWLFH